jgi:Glycosyltransferase family 87
MRQGLRENALCAFAAIAGCATIAWLGLYGFAWSDYEIEAAPSFDALAHGHLGEFLRLAPTYGGSLIVRAPFALLPGLWGGGSLAIYRMVALPCLLASAALGVFLVARMRGHRHSPLARAVALAVCVANPITLRALELGHPEELLGGCLCVAAVLIASHKRPLAAGIVLGLAIANKEWALLAAGPVLLALPNPMRLRCLAIAGAVTVAVLAPLALESSSGFAASAHAIASPASPIFQPWQLWWFAGHHGALVHGAFGVPKPGYRVAPAWTSLVSHPLIILLGFAVALALWPRIRGRALPPREALLALALVLLLRCLLDTWDAVYYPLPFLLALLSWEAHGAPTHPPVLALGSTVLIWFSFMWLPEHAAPDVQAAVFLAWSLPLTGMLGAWLFSRPQETTVSAFGRPVSTSGPSSPTTTRSSIRTPSSPGRYMPGSTVTTLPISSGSSEAVRDSLGAS